MMRKIFGIKSISHLIYGLLMLAPILAIGVKCGYAILNKNAYQSYYGQTINEKTTTNVQYNEMNIGDTYIFNNNEYVNLDVITYRPVIYVSDFINLGNQNQDYSSVDNLQFFKYPDDNPSRAVIYARHGTSVITEFQPSSSYISLQFTFEGYGANSNLLSSFNYFKKVNYNKNSYLDNVFYYAIDEIIQDNNFGKINFTGWFDNMMLDNNIQINQTYIHLFNWYLNYTLFISCAYILWLVLMWFVNFARKLLDRGMNYDW